MEPPPSLPDASSPPPPFPCCREVQELLRQRKVWKPEALGQLTVALSVGQCCPWKLTINYSLFLWRPLRTQAGIDWEVRVAPTTASLLTGRHPLMHSWLKKLPQAHRAFAF